jgi:hypothetical protein
MVAIGDSTGVNDKLLSSALAWYEQRARQVPSGLRDVDPRAVRSAYRLAGGVWNRCVADGPRSVIVHNRPVW